MLANYTKMHVAQAVRALMLGLPALPSIPQRATLSATTGPGKVPNRDSPTLFLSCGHAA
jgi:hypothetical protein